jgi:hypothetical protein
MRIVVIESNEQEIPFIFNRCDYQNKNSNKNLGLIVCEKGKNELIGMSGNLIVKLIILKFFR